MKMSSRDQSLSGEENESTSDSDEVALTLDGVENAKARAERLFDRKEFSAAADAISRVLAVLSEKYGEGSLECADSLYLYGKALYFHVIETVGTLGRSAAKYGFDPSATKGKDGRNYCEEGSGQGSDDASSIDEDLDLAYQVLSLAIKAYEKDKSSGSEMKIGDCYLCLGHVHFECERPEEALDCFKSGLEHKSKNLPAGHRELSELLYMCGVALQALGRYKESLEYTKKAKDNMTKKLEDINDVNTQDEIAQIREELADVDSKIEDLEYTIKLIGKAEYEKLLKIPQLSVMPSKKPKIVPQKVNDISNLIHVKDESASPKTKKPRI